MHAGYAYEIQTPLGGWGMEWLLGGRQYALNGVLNGIDYTEWDPATDKHLPANYSAADLPELAGKAACKRAMQVRRHPLHAPAHAAAHDVTFCLAAEAICPRLSALHSSYVAASHGSPVFHDGQALCFKQGLGPLGTFAAGGNSGWCVRLGYCISLSFKPPLPREGPAVPAGGARAARQR